MKRRTFLKSTAAGAALAASPISLLADTGKRKPKDLKPVGYIYLMTRAVYDKVCKLHGVWAHTLVWDKVANAFMLKNEPIDILIYRSGELLKVIHQSASQPRSMVDLADLPVIKKYDTLRIAVMSKKKVDVTYLTYIYSPSEKGSHLSINSIADAAWIDKPLAVFEREKRLLYGTR